MNVIDLRGTLPFDARYRAGSYVKTSATVHWTGIVLPRPMSDDDAINFLYAFAEDHIAKDWSPEVGVQHGAGLMYHDAVLPSGTVAICRDPNDELWHSGNAEGNRRSRAFLVVTGPRWLEDRDGECTREQLASLGARIREQQFNDVRGNREWSATACPGDYLQRWVDRDGWKEEHMTKDEIKAMLANEYELGPGTVKATRDILAEHDGRLDKLETAGGTVPHSHKGEVVLT